MIPRTAIDDCSGCRYPGGGESGRRASHFCGAPRRCRHGAFLGPPRVSRSFPPPRLPTRPPTTNVGATVRLAEVLSALTGVLDLTEGQRPGHTLRTTLIAMRRGAALGLVGPRLEAPYEAARLKDAGCSSNAARMAARFGRDDQARKRSPRLVDWHDRWRLAMHAARSCGIGRRPISRVRHFLLVACTPELTRQIIQARCERGAPVAHVLASLPSRASLTALRSVTNAWMAADIRGDGAPTHSRRPRACWPSPTGMKRRPPTGRLVTGCRCQGRGRHGSGSRHRLRCPAVRCPHGPRGESRACTVGGVDASGVRAIPSAPHPAKGSGRLKAVTVARRSPPTRSVRRGDSGSQGLGSGPSVR